MKEGMAVTFGQISRVPADYPKGDVGEIDWDVLFEPMSGIFENQPVGWGVGKYFIHNYLVTVQQLTTRGLRGCRCGAEDMADHESGSADRIKCITWFSLHRDIVRWKLAMWCGWAPKEFRTFCPHFVD